MAFGSVPVDGSGNNVPISSVYVPGDTFRALRGSKITNIDSSSNESVGVLTTGITLESILLGNVFTATVFATSGGVNAGLSLYIPASTSKNILIFAASGAGSGAGSFLQINTQTTDYALGSTGLVGPFNNNLASGTSSALTVTGNKTATIAGTARMYAILGSANTEWELLSPSTRCLFWPASQAGNFAFGLFLTPATTAANVHVSMSWLEY